MDFETWLAEQGDEVKGLIETHFGGLKSALESERGTRKQLEKELKTAVSQADAGSEMQRRLQEMERNLGAATQRAEFFAGAHAAGARNLTLAFLAAQDAGLLAEGGDVDWKKLQASFPELFAGGQPPPAGHAGDGMAGGGGVSGAIDMDALIRKQAGVG